MYYTSYDKLFSALEMWLINYRIVYFSFNSDSQIPRDLLILKNLRSFTLCKTQLLKVSRNLKCYSITKTLFPIIIIKN